jgi:hypothetical protein
VHCVAVTGASRDRVLNVARARRCQSQDHVAA